MKCYYLEEAGENSDFRKRMHSEPDPPYYSIVDGLIKQVTKLQNRIEIIESTSDVSLIESFLDQSFDTQPKMLNRNGTTRRYYSQDDLYQPASTHSTPQKPSKIMLNSLPNSPLVDRMSPRRSAVKFRSPQSSSKLSISKERRNPEVLHEIDAFISNVKGVQKNHAVRNLQNAFDNNSRSCIRKTDFIGTNNYPNNSDLSSNNKEIQETLNDLDRQSQRIIQEKTEIEKKDLKEIDVEILNKQRTWRCGDNVESVPDYGGGIRGTLYHNSEPTPKSTQETTVLHHNYKPISSSTDFTSYSTFDRSSDSSSDSTQLTAYKCKNKDKYNNSQKRPPNKKYDQDLYSIEQEISELRHSPVHDTALNVLDVHKKLLETKNTTGQDGRVHKKRGINTLSDNLGLLSLADIWGSHLSQSPSKLSQKLQEEKLRRQHCENLIQELQNRNLELQQKLAVAVKVDETKNNTIQQFKEALEKVSVRMEKLNEEKSTWDREITRLKNQHSIEIEAANQKIVYYEKEASKGLNLAHANQEKITDLEKKCTNLQSELKNIEGKFKEVEECYQNELEKNKILNEVVGQKEIELKENKSVLNNARDEVSHSRKAIEQCQTELTALKDKCAKLETELKNDKKAIINLSEQKRKLLNEIESLRKSENSLKENLEQSKSKIESTKVELRNFYQGQLEIIVENKRKELQTQLDHEREKITEEFKNKELAIAKTAAIHIKEITDKCNLENKLLEQKHLEEINLYEMQLAQQKKEVENLQARLAHLPEKRAQIARQLQKAMESQWNEALKMLSASPSTVGSDQGFSSTNLLPQKEFDINAAQALFYQRKSEKEDSDYDETPVSSRVGRQSESEIQKYINMLLNRPPGNPVTEEKDQKGMQNQQKAAWNPGVRPRKPK